MKIQLWSVGKSHEAYVKAGVEDFISRLNNYFSAEWELIPTPKNSAMLSQMDLKKQEALKKKTVVLGKTPAENIVVDEKKNN